MRFKGISYYLLPIFISVVFFVHGLMTLPNYGINWDAPFHYQRGQMMLRLFTTGKTDYKGVPECPNLQGSYMLTRAELLKKCPSPNNVVRSRFADSKYDLKYVKEIEDQGGHPPLGGFGGAITNVIFFGYLGLVSDGDSYQIFPLVVVFLLYLTVGVWTTQLYGKLAGSVAVITIGLYPLLLSEREFNFKDPQTAGFFVIATYLFWLAVTRKKLLYLFLSSLSLALCLYTKFNPVFFPFIILPWLFYYLLDFSRKIRLSKNAKSLVKWRNALWLLLYFVFPIVFLFLFWPRLWVDPIKKFYETIQYYKEIGSGIRYQADSEFFLGFSLYPLKYLLYTIPISTLVLTFVGFVSALFNIFRDKTKTLLLWVLLLAIPILRVVLPGMSSYGGIRQIMEFSGGMALLSGYGVYVVVNFIKRNFRFIPNYFFVIGVCLYFLPTLLILLKLHPNENLYFNELIGGIKGAREKNFEGWDQSFGNSYFQGMVWLNDYAEEKAQLAFSILGTDNYVAFSKLRPDIQTGGKYWSGTLKKGEYIIQTNLTGPQTQRYAVSFERKSLIPVYTIQVDGVDLGYVYKNTMEYTKPEFRKPEIELKATVDKSEDGYRIDLVDESIITKFTYSYEKVCKERPNGWIHITTGGKEVKLKETLAEQYYTLPEFSMGGDSDIAYYYFPYEMARSVRIEFDKTIAIDPNCPLKIDNIKIYGIK